MSGYSLRNPRQAFSGQSPGDRWTTDERSRLSYLRKLHSHLNWTQFYQLDFFPHRSQSALYSEYTKMEKSSARKRFQPNNDSRNAHPALKAKRPMLPDPRISQGPPDKQARIVIDDDEESNEDDGDIEDNGQTMPLQGHSLRPQEHTSHSPDRSRNALTLTPSPEAQPATALPPQQRTSYSSPDRPAVPVSQTISNTVSEVVPTVQTLQPMGPPLPPSTIRPTTQSLVMQAHTPQSLGVPAVNQQTGPPPAIPPTPDHEISHTPAAEPLTTLNLSLPPRPPTPPTTMTPAKAMVLATATTIDSSTSAPQNRSTPMTPAPGVKPNPATHRVIAPVEYLLKTARSLQQEHDERTGRESCLEAEVAMSRQRLEQSESMQKELRERLDAQTKELEELKSSAGEQSAVSARYVEQWKAQEDLNASRSKEIAALTKNLEELKKDTEKAVKFQDMFRGFEEWKVLDMISVVGMVRTARESNRQSPSADNVVQE